MTKLTIILTGAAALAGGLAAAPGPALAQAQPVGEIVVYGTDPCPRATDDSVVICRRLPEAMRYRLPEAYRPGATFQERQSWANKARVMQNVGATGTGTCSPVGPGGHTGCLVQEIREAREQREVDVDATVVPEQ